jgi:hypothetical protein
VGLKEREAERGGRGRKGKRGTNSRSRIKGEDSVRDVIAGSTVRGETTDDFPQLDA